MGGLTIPGYPSHVTLRLKSRGAWLWISLSPSGSATIVFTSGSVWLNTKVINTFSQPTWFSSLATQAGVATTSVRQGWHCSTCPTVFCWLNTYWFVNTWWVYLLLVWLTSLPSYGPWCIFEKHKYDVAGVSGMRDLLRRCWYYGRPLFGFHVCCKALGWCPRGACTTTVDLYRLYVPMCLVYSVSIKWSGGDWSMNVWANMTSNAFEDPSRFFTWWSI